MPATAVIGCQWGDEGKGRVVDMLAQRADVVARFNGGGNAGHTVINSFGTFPLHLVPCGIFNPKTMNIIGNGVVLDPRRLLDEIDGLRKYVPKMDNLFLSSRAHVTMPYHYVIERLQEEALGDRKIGTTGRGIGPTYTDKVARTGIRVGDLLNRDFFARRLRTVLEAKNQLITRLYGGEALDYGAMLEQYVALGERLRPFVADTELMISDALAQGRNLILEGAQGALLDVDFGTYEFVTSSPTTASGACQGVGVAPQYVNCVIGVYKAYTSRVGAGPAPTELNDETGQRIRDLGQEYGATTGRPRRCGWFDGVAARYVRRVNALTGVVLTRLDVLDTLRSLKVSVAYMLDGKRIEHLPSAVEDLTRCEPIYEEMPGWQRPTSDIRRFADLPANARAYVNRLEALIGAPVVMVSVGPERDQMVFVPEKAANCGFEGDLWKGWLT